jgi:hypothetical protein
MLDAPKAFEIVGGASTVSGAVLLTVPVPPSVEVMLPVVLTKDAAAAAVTFTEKLHEPLDVIVPPLRLTDEVPAVAVIVPLPQLPVKPEGVAIARPAGKLSVKPTPDSDCVVFALLMVKLSDVDPFTGMVEAPKALAMVGGATTVSVAGLLVVPVPPSTEVMAPVVLILTPAVVPVTVTESAHEAPDAIEAPLRLTDVLADVGEKVPPQVFVAPGLLAT